MELELLRPGKIQIWILKMQIVGKSMKDLDNFIKFLKQAGAELCQAKHTLS